MEVEYDCPACDLTYSEPANLMPAEARRCPRCHAHSWGTVVRINSQTTMVDKRVNGRLSRDAELAGDRSPTVMSRSLIASLVGKKALPKS